jgi:septal ring factor EnvC (AmiA/AmiB activator)
MQKHMAGFKLSEQETLQEAAALSEAVKTGRRRARELEQELTRTSELQARQDAELADVSAREKASRARLALRLRHLYRMTKAERSATLFQLARARSFARDTELLARVQALDQAALRRAEALQRELSLKTAALRTTMARLRGLAAELETERAQLVVREQGLKDSLRDIKRNQHLYAKYLADLEGVQVSMQEAVAKLEQDRAASGRAAPDPPALRGRLLSPVAGAKLLERFGEQGHALKKFQRGLVLGPAEGASARAAAAGNVVYAGPFRGFEELVVLDHGKGLFTVYGHLDKLAVAKGAWLEGGAQLGTVAWQPENNRAELYFEVRFDGKPEDPQQWLAEAMKGPAK